jgi:hypothetical protein
MNRPSIVEWAPFQLRGGASEAELFEASGQIQEQFLSRQHGFVRRDLLRWKNDCWVDIVYWIDRESADAAMKAAAESTVCQRYFQLMANGDQTSLDPGVLLFERMASYP